jgi:hypothetical protein
MGSVDIRIARVERFSRMKHLPVIRDILGKAFLILLALGCLAFAVCVGWILWELRDWEPFVAQGGNNPELIEANMDIQLPPSAREIQYYYTGFREFSMYVRFTMVSSDLPQFLDSTLCETPLREYDPSRQGTAPPDWWRPVDAERLQGCSGGREGFQQVIRIDMTDPDTYIVYVFAGTT